MGEVCTCKIRAECKDHEEWWRLNGECPKHNPQNRHPTDSERLDWLDLHSTFVADGEFNIGPFKVGELREMADAGIKASKKGKR